MAVVMGTPAPDQLAEVIGALREWQDDAAPFQLHPGDVAWFWRFGDEATAAAVRTWRRDGRIVAAGLLDGGVLRLTTAPGARRDAELGRQLVEDVTRPERGILPAGKVSIEVPRDALLRDLLSGWDAGEPWSPLSRDLGDEVRDPGLRIEVVGPELASVQTEVHRASFDRSTFTDERWQAMAGGPAYADARCLVAYDARGSAVAATTVWSAGPGRPGLLEPLGVHRDHRGHGHGRAVSVAAAAVLRELGSSSALVCTPSANVGAVATYASAGYRRLPEVSDVVRPA